MKSSFDSSTSSFLSSPPPSISAVSSIRTQIIETVEESHKFTPREHQIQALESLTASRDTILYAPTSAGKSLIAQIYPRLRPGWVLSIIPLTRLGDEQVKTINAFPATNAFPPLKAFLLHDQTNNAAGRQELITLLEVQGCTHGEWYLVDPPLFLGSTK